MLQVCETYVQRNMNLLSVFSIEGTEEVDNDGDIVGDNDGSDDGDDDGMKDEDILGVEDGKRDGNEDVGSVEDMDGDCDNDIEGYCVDTFKVGETLNEFVPVIFSIKSTMKSREK